MKTIKNYIKQLMEKFSEHNVTLLAAGQAYYYLLSIFPLLIVAFAIIPYLNLDVNQVMDTVEKSLPSGMAEIFEDNIVSLIETPKGGLLTIGIIGALWSASNGVNAFIKSANSAYGVEETRSFIVVRAMALGLTIGLIIALGVAITLPIFGNTIVKYLDMILSLGSSKTILIQILRWAISIIVLTGILLMFYRFAPNKNLPFKDTLPGALVASIAWLLISFGFSFYIDNFGNYSATYGSLGGIIILMMWFFLTGIILMVGALINVIYQQNQQNTNEAKDMKKSREA
ncbi:YihY/virulence factor BrkB family protein [Virgibacillus sp. MSJ-26]|uniref:YihY/virulence factor BrkB family protein n=1 Tax=Virgibacillus sp. MSJ-26 TaxID=2841522 RepID=UPI001C0F8C03|nr:YihY/virulence factor BrkB family protein [Virgibacillus sp. MSJ-26]MBU5468061.1 YihY/virulence factor BrkB family protein [Virgibacillus sp. MSJ-26]